MRALWLDAESLMCSFDRRHSKGDERAGIFEVSGKICKGAWLFFGVFLLWNIENYRGNVRFIAIVEHGAGCANNYSEYYHKTN